MPMNMTFLRYTLPLAAMLCISLLSSCAEESDGNSCNIDDYRKTRIGNQVWMAENFNCDVAGSKCYDNEPSNCKKYGRLYKWEAAKTVCPSGWRLPSDEDWNELISYVENENGCDNCAGKYLKATKGWNEKGNGQDTYEFSALPGGGWWNGDTGGTNVGSSGYWWASEGLIQISGGGETVSYYNSNHKTFYQVENSSYSVRCVTGLFE